MAPAMQVRTWNPPPRAPARPGQAAWRRWANSMTRDAALVTAGLSLLIMVPLVSEMMTEEPAGMHFQFPDGAKLPAELGIPEPGADALAPGGRAGEAQERIAELTGRDPLSLIRGPERPAAAPAAASSLPPAPKAAPTDWGSVIKDAARSAVPLAMKKAGLPTPHPKLAAAVRGLMEKGSGGSTSASEGMRLPAPSSAGLLSALRARDSVPLHREDAPFRGVSRRGAGDAPLVASLPPGMRPASASGGGGEVMRDALASTGYLTSAHSAFGGGPGAGDVSKAPGATPVKDAKGQGESLAYLKAKMQMEKELELQYAKRTYNELGRQQMLDKVQAEGAMQMAQTVAGKMLDGMFGLAQKGIESAKKGGSQGGGDGSTAVGANEKADAARGRLDAANGALGQAADRTTQAAQQVNATKDGYLVPNVGAPVGSAAGSMQAAQAAYSSASGSLRDAKSNLAQANSSLGKVNQATDEQKQSMQSYVDATGARIDGWQIEAFNPGAAAQLGAAHDSAQDLGDAESHRATAQQANSAAQQAAGAAPGDISGPQSVLRQNISSPQARRQQQNYASLSSLPAQLDANAQLLAKDKAEYESTKAETANALDMNGQAKQAAGDADQQGKQLFQELKTFDGQLNIQTGILSMLSVQYQWAMASNPPSAPAIKQQFEGTKGSLRSQLQAEAQKLPTLQEAVNQAKQKLGDAAGGAQ